MYGGIGKAEFPLTLASIRGESAANFHVKSDWLPCSDQLSLDNWRLCPVSCVNHWFYS